MIVRGDEDGLRHVPEENDMMGYLTVMSFEDLFQKDRPSTTQH